MPPIVATFLADRDKYMCGNRIHVRPRDGSLYDPDATYAILVTDAIRNAAPSPGTLASPDLAALLAATAPDDPDLQPAWKLFTGVRAALPGLGLNPGRVVHATVFTTGHPRQMMQALHQAAEQAPLPKLAEPMMLCSPKVVSPCATPDWAKTDAGKTGLPDPRACPAKTSALFHEFHARLTVPVWQQGNRPYLDKGGGLLWQGGLPVPAGTENVCLSLAIPKAPMPAGGWPVVLFAHGTNGSFRTGPDLIGEAMAALQLPGGAVQRIATLTLDMPMHGPRRGADLDPGLLVYNVANPVGSRGTFLQGAADLVALRRWVVAYQATLPILGTPLKFDPTRVVVVGHSQGGTTAPMMLPYGKGVAGAVLSGAGGSLIHGLLGKKKPIDAALGLRFLLQELELDDRHPVLELLQAYFEPADPLIHGPLIHAAPLAKPLPVLHFYGHADQFTAPASTRILAAAMRQVLGAPTPVPGWFDPVIDLGLTTLPLPIALGTPDATGKSIWGVTVQAQPTAANAFSGKPYDGHFVAFEDKTAFRQFQLFVASVMDGKPVVSAP